jgi:type II secretory pathway pseudopilin PulG
MNASKITSQKGQTLIETMVAVFILVVGIAAATGLAIFSLNASSNITKQIIATGLAREGLEAIRSMRDTNWLRGTLSTNCFNYQPPYNNDAKCYLNWLTEQEYPIPGVLGSTLDPSPNPSNYVVGFGNTGLWTNKLGLTQVPSTPVCANPGYALDFSSDPNNHGTYGQGYYRPSCLATGSSDYYRRIILQTDSTAPYNQNVGPRLIVTSQVWWKDKKCPAVSTWPGLGKCSIQLVTYLTNWKNY